MKIKDILILEEAFEDLLAGKAFYDLQEQGVGEYFWDCLIADIESLVIFGGVHSKNLGLYQLFAKRFPYTVYYDVIENFAYVVAVLPMRRNPTWIAEKIQKRR